MLSTSTACGALEAVQRGTRAIGDMRRHRLFLCMRPEVNLLQACHDPSKVNPRTSWDLRLGAATGGLRTRWTQACPCMARTTARVPLDPSRCRTRSKTLRNGVPSPVGLTTLGLWLSWCTRFPAATLLDTYENGLVTSATCHVLLTSHIADPLPTRPARARARLGLVVGLSFTCWRRLPGRTFSAAPESNRPVNPADDARIWKPSICLSCILDGLRFLVLRGAPLSHSGSTTKSASSSSDPSG